MPTLCTCLCCSGAVVEFRLLRQHRRWRPDDHRARYHRHPRGRLRLAAVPHTKGRHSRWLRVREYGHYAGDKVRLVLPCFSSVCLKLYLKIYKDYEVILSRTHLDYSLHIQTQSVDRSSCVSIFTHPRSSKLITYWSTVYSIQLRFFFVFFFIYPDGRR